ncbi:MAG TPA: response regulator transcription factor [Vicinamibacteria bacterium]
MSLETRRRVLIVDDHPIVRQGLTQLISQENDLEVVGEADDAETAIAAVSRLAPDVVIVDLMLRDSSGIELIKDIKATRPAARILVVSMHDEAVYAERALRAGSHGYIMKEEATNEVLSALRTVLADEVYVSKDVVSRMLRRIVGGGPSDGINRLSDRELEVFQWIGHGLSVNEIAEKLKVSPKTIETYRAHIKEKLGLASSADVLRVAVSWLEQKG